MSPLFRIAFFYFAIVFGSGFILGVFRVLYLIPHIGIRYGELLEMPLMYAVIRLSAGWILRRYGSSLLIPRFSLWVGIIAFILLVICEATGAFLQGYTLSTYLYSRDPISFSVYVLLLFVYMMMPYILFKREKSSIFPH
ncbi:MAG: hypothetical protein AB7S65_03190 [Sulfuricurvum sp.]